MRLKRFVLIFSIVIGMLCKSDVCRAEEYYIAIEDGHITEDSLDSICQSVGRDYDISPILLKAIVFTESDCEVMATGYSGDKGLCQIVEHYHTDRMEKLGIADIYNPYDNVRLCADILSELKDSEYGNDIFHTLMAYNMGAVNATEIYEDGKISMYAYKVMNTYFEQGGGYNE